MGHTEKGKKQIIVNGVPTIYQVNLSAPVANQTNLYEVVPIRKAIEGTAEKVDWPALPYLTGKLPKKYYEVSASRRLPAFEEPMLVVGHGGNQQLLQTIYTTCNGPFIVTMTFESPPELTEEFHP